MTSFVPMRDGFLCAPKEPANFNSFFLNESFILFSFRDIIRNAVNASEHDAVIFVGTGCTAAVHKLIHSLHLQSPPVSIRRLLFQPSHSLSIQNHPLRSLINQGVKEWGRGLKQPFKIRLVYHMAKLQLNDHLILIHHSFIPIHKYFFPKPWEQIGQFSLSSPRLCIELVSMLSA